MRPCAPVVTPIVATPPLYAIESTAAATPATLARRSVGCRPSGRLDTVRVKAVPPAVERQGDMWEMWGRYRGDTVEMSGRCWGDRGEIEGR